MKVSFDFDHTLTNPKYQELAKSFIKSGAEVSITTQRESTSLSRKLPYDNREVFRIANELGIQKVVFTEKMDKYKFLKDHDLHFDDDEEQIMLINDHPCKCIGVLIH